MIIVLHNHFEASLLKFIIQLFQQYILLQFSSVLTMLILKCSYWLEQQGR